MSKPPGISQERQALYYTGAVVMGLGFLLFISNFFVVASSFGTDPMSGGSSMNGMAARGIGGMVLMALGAFLRQVGARGAAGSGLVLDPQQAREDLKPWAQTAGGLVKDALAELKPDSTAQAQEPAVVVKVRCAKCQALNAESAKFCNQCGQAM